MKFKEMSIAEALTIRYSALESGRKRYSSSEIRRANDLLKKAGKILDALIEIEYSDPEKKKRK